MVSASPPPLGPSVEHVRERHPTRQLARRMRTFMAASSAAVRAEYSDSDTTEEDEMPPLASPSAVPPVFLLQRHHRGGLLASVAAAAGVSLDGPPETQLRPAAVTAITHRDGTQNSSSAQPMITSALSTSAASSSSGGHQQQPNSQPSASHQRPTVVPSSRISPQLHRETNTAQQHDAQPTTARVQLYRPGQTEPVDERRLPLRPPHRTAASDRVEQRTNSQPSESDPTARLASPLSPELARGAPSAATDLLEAVPVLRERDALAAEALAARAGPLPVWRPHWLPSSTSPFPAERGSGESAAAPHALPEPTSTRSATSTAAAARDPESWPPHVDEPRPKFSKAPVTEPQPCVLSEEEILTQQQLQWQKDLLKGLVDHNGVALKSKEEEPSKSTTSQKHTRSSHIRGCR